MPPPKDPEKYKLFCENSSRVSKLYWSSDKNKLEHKNIMKEINERPEVKLKKSNTMKKISNKPEVKLKHSEDMKNIWKNPDIKLKYKNAMNSDEYKSKRRKSTLQRFEDPDFKLKHKKSVKKSMDIEGVREKMVEFQIGGFWYGNVRYNNEKKYCELWTDDLRMRIRSFFGNVSVLSGKTKSDNCNRNMSCHHVYYQKKACCVWDEDLQGYYAMIDGEKYYIKGDPNKFVTLTAGENRIVEKDKLKWVKIFEDIIENKYNGKCYYTKNKE